jgi:hypothetical protein
MFCMYKNIILGNGPCIKCCNYLLFYIFLCAYKHFTLLPWEERQGWFQLLEFSCMPEITIIIWSPAFNF